MLSTLSHRCDRTGIVATRDWLHDPTRSATGQDASGRKTPASRATIAAVLAYNAESETDDGALFLSSTAIRSTDACNESSWRSRRALASCFAVALSLFLTLALSACGIARSLERSLLRAALTAATIACASLLPMPIATSSSSRGCARTNSSFDPEKPAAVRADVTTAAAARCICAPPALR